MSDSFLRLLVQLGEDPLFARGFKADPVSAMAAIELSDEERQALLSRDPAKIRVLLTEQPSDRDWLLFAWFGSLAADEDPGAS